MTTDLSELIREFLAGTPGLTVQKTDDGVVVFFRTKYSPETGTSLAPEVVGHVKSDDINAALSELEAAKSRMTAFLAQLDLGAPAPKLPVDKSVIPDSFISALGAARGMQAWAEGVKSQDPRAVYWNTFLLYKQGPLNAASPKVEAGLTMLTQINGSNGQPILTSAEAAAIAEKIRESLA